jgi:voltage-gated potassium channel
MLTLGFGTCGYIIFEDMTLFEALYMTVITISTVGFSEIKPLTIHGRIITLFIILTGVALGGYTLSMIVRIILEGELRKSYWRRKLERQISKLKDHFIVCGFGRIGRLVCTELKADNIDFVVIEKSPSAIEQAEKEGILNLYMDATSEETLIKAGIQSAKGIVTAVRSDANNVFITLTAKGLRPDIFVLARSSDPKNEEKLRRAGASRVVCPYLIGGRRMAEILKRPTVVDFIDIAMMGSKLGLMIEEAKVGPDSHLIGKTLVESNLRKDFGVIIVAIKRKKTDDMIFNPLPNQVLNKNDVIVVLGKKEDLKKMNEVL